MKPRFSVLTYCGRTLIVYADGPLEADLFVHSKGYKPQPGGTQPAGHWDPSLGCDVGDPFEVHVEGDVYARPKKVAK